MYSFVARQPILDTKQKTVAYELLFRQGLTNAFPKISSEQATTTLISEQFLNQPLESLVGESLAFINFPILCWSAALPTAFLPTRWSSRSSRTQLLMTFC